MVLKRGSSRQNRHKREGNTPVRGPPMIRRQFLGMLFVFLFIAPVCCPPSYVGFALKNLV